VLVELKAKVEIESDVVIVGPATAALVDRIGDHRCIGRSLIKSRLIQFRGQTYCRGAKAFRDTCIEEGRRSGHGQGKPQLSE